MRRHVSHGARAAAFGLSFAGLSFFATAALSQDASSSPPGALSPSSTLAAKEPVTSEYPAVSPDPETDRPVTDDAKTGTDSARDPASGEHHPVAGETSPGAPSTEPAADKKPEESQPSATTKAADAQSQPKRPVFALEELRDLLPKVQEGAEASEETKAISATYGARRDDTIWVTPTGLNAKGLSALAEIKKADDWGLEAADYVLPSLPDGASSTTELPRGQLAEAEMKLSFAVLAYARDARGGRITQPSKQLSSYLDRDPQVIEPRILLEEIADAADPGDVLRKLHPQHPQFEKLRQKYLELRSKADSANDVVRLPSSGPKLVPGMKHRDVGFLRQRLGVSVASAGGVTADETVYDVALVEAVKTFQEKNGQKPDGIVGKSTRAALNDITVPDPQRLLANMEQWRWMPADMGETYINVNIPEFKVRVVQNGKVTFEERIVTGQIDKQTPVFSDELETIYFHPRWNVPESIKVLELYPSLARGGGSFQRQGLKLVRNGREISPSSVDWGSADIRNFDVYQPSGDGNVLGLVKFVFPNKHGVYLHDTTAKALFDEPSRPFSHGCMRVRNPLHFAEALLAIDKQWPASAITDILDREPDETAVQLDKKIPIHVTYFTDVINDSGEEQIFKDVYGHEQRIKLALAGKFDQIAIGRDHLAPVDFKRVQYAQSPDDFGSFFGFGSTSNNSSSSYSGGGGNTSLGDFFNNVFGGGNSPSAKQQKRKTRPSNKPN